MKMGEHKRVKHGETPGNIHRSRIIFMREKVGKYGREGFSLFPWQYIDARQAKALRKYLVEKGKAVQRRRDKQAILDGLKEE